MNSHYVLYILCVVKISLHISSHTFVIYSLSLLSRSGNFEASHVSFHFQKHFHVIFFYFIFLPFHSVEFSLVLFPAVFLNSLIFFLFLVLLLDFSTADISDISFSKYFSVNIQFLCCRYYHRMELQESASKVCVFYLFSFHLKDRSLTF